MEKTESEAGHYNFVGTCWFIGSGFFIVGLSVLFGIGGTLIGFGLGAMSCALLEAIDPS